MTMLLMSNALLLGFFFLALNAPEPNALLKVVGLGVFDIGLDGLLLPDGRDKLRARFCNWLAENNTKKI